MVRTFLPQKKWQGKDSAAAALSPPKRISVYSRSPDSISSSGPPSPFIRVVSGTVVHHTVERAVLDFHQIPFSMRKHHYIRYCLHNITDIFSVPIDNFNVFIEVFYIIIWLLWPPCPRILHLPDLPCPLVLL